MTTETISWNGKHVFRIAGSRYHEDTLRIDSVRAKGEERMQLVLPTLCLTYTDMAFANDIGGEQAPYPHSAAYGPAHFDPPVEINGEAEVERLTWIRGAHRVQIGPRETVIEWYLGRRLVIPRLRIREDKPATATLVADGIPVYPREKVDIDIRQYTDGRLVGGLTASKRHPTWEPEKVPPEYELRVNMRDGHTGEPMVEAPLVLYRESPKAQGVFTQELRHYTDGSGNVHLTGLSTGGLRAVTLDLPGVRCTPRCFRPLPGQRVSLSMLAWPMKREQIRYRWDRDDTVKRLEMLTSLPRKDLVGIGGQRLQRVPGLGATVRLPAYRAMYSLEPRDTLDWLVQAFAYKDANELARLNGCLTPDELAQDPIHLHGWFFVHAPTGDTFERLDQAFGLPSGWVRPVGRVHHPDPTLPWPGEVLAVPTARFMQDHASLREQRKTVIQQAGVTRRFALQARRGALQE